MKLYIVVLLTALLFIPLSAQDFDTFKRRQQETFQMHKQKAQAEWDAYRKRLYALTGKAKEITPTMWVLAILFILRHIFI